MVRRNTSFYERIKLIHSIISPVSRHHGQKTYDPESINDYKNNKTCPRIIQLYLYTAVPYTDIQFRKADQNAQDKRKQRQRSDYGPDFCKGTLIPR